MQPIYDEQRTLVNFQLVYRNATAQELTGPDVQMHVGAYLLRATPEQIPHANESFQALLAICQSGEPTQQTYYSEDHSRWMSVSRSKLNGGVLSILRDVTPGKSAQQQVDEQADLMQTMLDGAINGVLLLDPLLDDSGEILDFQVLAANQAVEAHTGVSVEQAVGNTMVSVFPAYKASGFFAFYCTVLQTGQPQRQEFFYDDSHLRGWFEVSAARQSGKIVLTFTNTTTAHESLVAADQAAAHLQQIIDSSQTGIFMFKPVPDETGQIVDFRFTAINRMVAALVGQLPDKIQGAVASDWFISYRETGLFDHYLRTYTTGEPQRFDINYNVDGFDVWFDVQSVKLGDEVLVTFTDYTLLKQAQQAQERQAADNQRQTDLINSVLDSSDSGILAFEAIRDPAQPSEIVDFRFVVANQACVGLLGLPLDAMIGQRLLSIFPGNVETGLFDLYKQTTETGNPGRTEVYYNHDGLDFWLDISTQKLGDGFVVTFTDVSPIKRANKAIEASAAELTTVIDTAQAGIFLFEPVFDEQNEVADFRFRLANRQLAAYVGQEPAALIGELGSRWFPDYKANGLFDTYLKAYQTGRTQRFDFHYDGDGIDVWLDIMSTKMGNAVLVTFADYTNLKRLQRQLEHSIIDLSRSNESLQQFAYVASHDLQEPLRKIQSFGDVLQGRFGPELGEMGSDIVGRMQTAAGRMSNLIHDLLTYSRLSAKPAVMKTIALTSVLARVTDDLDMPIRESGATIEANGLPAVPGEESQLRQLFQNLMSNALKFRHAHTPLRITISSYTVAADDLPELVVPLRKVPVYQCVMMKDNGIGFDQKYAGRIFQVFQRLHARAQYDGTGIGLAIVQRVIDNHGGAIRASSEPGQGATFEVYLPA